MGADCSAVAAAGERARKPEGDLREVLNAIRYMARTGVTRRAASTPISALSN